MLCLKALQELWVSSHFLFISFSSLFLSNRWERPWNALSCPMKWAQLCETWDVSVQWLQPCREWMLNAPQKSWLCSHWKKMGKLTLTLNGSRISVVCMCLIGTVLCVHTVTSVCWNTCVWEQRWSVGPVLVLGKARVLPEILSHPGC